MASYDVRLRDGRLERVERVDACRREGPLTTFVRLGEGRDAIDVWSTRVASYRTETVQSIRYVEGSATPRVSPAT